MRVTPEPTRGFFTQMWVVLTSSVQSSLYFQGMGLIVLSHGSSRSSWDAHQEIGTYSQKEMEMQCITSIYSIMIETNGSTIGLPSSIMAC